MKLGQIALSAALASIPDLACTLTAKDGTAFNVVCPGVSRFVQASEIGLSFSSSIQVRIDEDTDPTNLLKEKAEVTLTYTGKDYHCRIGEVSIMQGIKRVVLEAIHG